MNDVDEICNSQHTCEWIEHVSLFLQFKFIYAISTTLPTNLFSSLSHKGAALKPFATSAKKAFCTLKEKRQIRVSVDMLSFSGARDQIDEQGRESTYLKLGIKYD